MFFPCLWFWVESSLSLSCDWMWSDSWMFFAQIKLNPIVSPHCSLHNSSTEGKSHCVTSQCKSPWPGVAGWVHQDQELAGERTRSIDSLQELVHWKQTKGGEAIQDSIQPKVHIFSLLHAVYNNAWVYSPTFPTPASTPPLIPGFVPKLKEVQSWRAYYNPASGPHNTWVPIELWSLWQILFGGIVKHLYTRRLPDFKAAAS